MSEHDDVHALWLDHLTRTHAWNTERTDADCDRLVERVIDQLRRQPGSAPRLRAALHETDDDDDYSDFLFSVLVPDRHLAQSDPDAFRAHPEVGFTAEQMPIRLSSALPRVTVFPSTKDESELARYTATWFGGRPLAPAGKEWPRSVDGTPLAHVVQVVLRDGYEDLPEEIGLPPHGLLQIFHDLHTYGEPEDGGSGAWLVRWLDVEDHTPLVPTPRPDDLPSPARIAPVPARISPMATIPSSLDFDDEDEDAQERYEGVATWLEQ